MIWFIVVSQNLSGGVNSKKLNASFKKVWPLSHCPHNHPKARHECYPLDRDDERDTPSTYEIPGSIYSAGAILQVSLHFKISYNSHIQKPCCVEHKLWRSNCDLSSSQGGSTFGSRH